MLKAVRRFIEEAFSTADPGAEQIDREQALQVATAALLLEMQRADHERSDAEREAILRMVREHFELAADQALALLDSAHDEADQAVSLHEFTALLHKHLDEPGKQRVVEMLWEVAYADGELGKYEEHLVRKVADLLYVRHVDLMRLKHRALKRWRG